MTPMMKVINALNALVTALQELAVQETKAETSTFEEIVPEQETAPETQAEQPAPAKEQQEITVADVRRKLAEKSRMGFKEEVMELVRKYGAEKVSGLNPEVYPAVLKEAERIGK